MTEATLIINKPAGLHAGAPVRPSLDIGFNARSSVVFFAVLACALFFIAYSLYVDVSAERHAADVLAAVRAARRRAASSRSASSSSTAFTTPRTRSRPSSTRTRCRRSLAVVWSGLFNFLGVLASSGAVAYGIIALLPVELILQVGSSAGFAMVFALLIGAIIWNLGTWYLGLPASSSHTLIGSIIGVGLANQMMAGGRRQRRRLGAGRARSATRCCSRRSSASARRRCCC